jgi:hypothetical protein
MGFFGKTTIALSSVLLACFTPAFANDKDEYLLDPEIGTFCTRQVVVIKNALTSSLLDLSCYLDLDADSKLIPKRCADKTPRSMSDLAMRDLKIIMPTPSFMTICLCNFAPLKIEETQFGTKFLDEYLLAVELDKTTNKLRLDRRRMVFVRQLSSYQQGGYFPEPVSVRRSLDGLFTPWNLSMDKDVLYSQITFGHHKSQTPPHEECDSGWNIFVSTKRSSK